MEEFGHVSFFEHALILKTAEAEYAKNPLDADNLTRWGVSLLKLSQFESSSSKKMNREAISKLEEALVVDPKKHDALWWLGYAHVSQGMSIRNTEEAKLCFDKAGEYFQQAVDEDPHNQVYRQSLEVAAKTFGAHEQKKQPTQTAGSSSSSNSSGCKLKGIRRRLSRVFICS